MTAYEVHELGWRPVSLPPRVPHYVIRLHLLKRVVFLNSECGAQTTRHGASNVNLYLRSEQQSSTIHAMTTFFTQPVVPIIFPALLPQSPGIYISPIPSI